MRVKVYASAGVGNSDEAVIEGHWATAKELVSDVLDCAIQLTHFECSGFVIDEQTGEEIEPEDYFLFTENPGIAEPTDLKQQRDELLAELKDLVEINNWTSKSWETRLRVIRNLIQRCEVNQ